MSRDTSQTASGRKVPGTWQTSTYCGRRGVQELTEQAGEVGEVAGAADVQRVRGIPLDDVGLYDVVGVERGAVVELDAVTQREGPLGQILVGRPLGGQRGDHLAGAGLVGQQCLHDLLASAEGFAVRLVGAVEAEAQRSASRQRSRPPGFIRPNCSAPMSEA